MDLNFRGINYPAEVCLNGHKTVMPKMGCFKDILSLSLIFSFTHKIIVGNFLLRGVKVVTMRFIAKSKTYSIYILFYFRITYMILDPMRVEW